MKQSDLEKSNKFTKTSTGGLRKSSTKDSQKDVCTPRADGGPGSGPHKGGGNLREETKAKARAAFKQDPDAAGRLHNQLKAYVPKDENQKTVLAATHAALAEHYASKAYDQEQAGEDHKGYQSLSQEHAKAAADLDFQGHLTDMFAPPSTLRADGGPGSGPHPSDVAKDATKKAVEAGFKAKDSDSAKAAGKAADAHNKASQLHQAAAKATSGETSKFHSSQATAHDRETEKWNKEETSRS